MSTFILAHGPKYKWHFAENQAFHTDVERSAL